MYTFSRLKAHIPGITATTTESSSSDDHHEVSQLSTESAISPLSPFMTVFKEYDLMKNHNHHQYKALIKSHSTTKASLLADAVTKKTITDAEYSDLTFRIRVVEDKSSYDSFDKLTFPIVMCIDEGNYEDLKEEIARVFGVHTWKLAKLEVLIQDLNEPSRNRTQRLGKDTSADLQRLKAMGNLGQILVSWGV